MILHKIPKLSPPKMVSRKIVAALITHTNVTKINQKACLIWNFYYRIFVILHQTTKCLFPTLLFDQNVCLWLKYYSWRLYLIVRFLSFWTSRWEVPTWLQEHSSSGTSLPVNIKAHNNYIWLRNSFASLKL